MQKETKNQTAKIALELQGVSKAFGMVHANRNINLKVEVGTVHGVIGENGAGKSTLMNILYGLLRADSGKILIHGKEVVIRASADSLSLGIGMVHQHFMLIPSFSVLENVMLGSEGGQLLNDGRQSTLEKIDDLCALFDTQLDAHALVEDLNVGMQQRVEIIKALKGGADILILDEPTGVLTPQEVTQLFSILRKLCKNGVTVLLITHKLAEIMSITDNVSIMRAGQMVGHRKTSDTSPQELADLMVGRTVLLDVEKPKSVVGDIVVSAKSLSCYSPLGHTELNNLSIEVRSGEVLGVAGVSGNGQTPLMEVLTGMRTPDGGEVNLLGRNIHGTSALTPAEMREIGVAHVPEDRHKHGLVLSFSSAENMVLGFHRWSIAGKDLLLDSEAIHGHCQKQMEKFDIRPPDPTLPASDFSGGNQQKIVVAREFYHDPKLLIIGEPTRGVDIGAIEFIYKQIMKLRERGCAIILISVELDEIMSLSDRILVLNKGEEVKTVDASQTSANELGLLMAGVREGNHLD